MPVDALPDQNQPQSSAHARRIWARWVDLSVRSRNTFGKLIRGPEDVQKHLLENPNWKVHFLGMRNVGAKTIREVNSLILDARQMSLSEGDKLEDKASGRTGMQSLSFDEVSAVNHFMGGVQGLSRRSNNVIGTFLRDGGYILYLLSQSDSGFETMMSVRNCGHKSAREIALLVKRSVETAGQGGEVVVGNVQSTGLSSSLIPLVEGCVETDGVRFQTDSFSARRVGTAVIGGRQLVVDLIRGNWDAWTGDALLERLRLRLVDQQDLILEILERLGMVAELIWGGRDIAEREPRKYFVDREDRNRELWIEHRIKGRTLEEIGQSVGLTRERVRQVVRKQDRQFNWESGLGKAIPEVRWVHIIEDKRMLLFPEGSEARELEVEGLVQSSSIGGTRTWFGSMESRCRERPSGILSHDS